MSVLDSTLRPGCPHPPVPNRSHLFPPIQTAVAPLFACTADSVFHPAVGVDWAPRENVFLSACTDEGCGWKRGTSVAAQVFCTSHGAHSPGTRRVLGRGRARWQKKIADLRQWTETSSERSQARAARPHIKKARLTSGPARKPAKPAARAGWRVIAGNSNNRGQVRKCPILTADPRVNHRPETTSRTDR